MQWRSRWYARWPNHEFVDFGCRHRTMSVVWTAQTSRAGYIAAIYPLRCRAAWNPSKPPRHSSFVHRYLWRIFWFFSVLHTKNQETYFHQWILYELMTNYLLKHNFFLKKNIILFSKLPSCRVILSHPPRNIVMRAIPLEFVLYINNLLKIKIIIY